MGLLFHYQFVNCVQQTNIFLNLFFSAIYENITFYYILVVLAAMRH